jgi:hypothetical protein
MHFVVVFVAQVQLHFLIFRRVRHRTELSRVAAVGSLADVIFSHPVLSYPDSVWRA